MPTPDAWRRFRAELDDIGVWAWRPYYTPPDYRLTHGWGWTLDIQYADRTLQSEGHDANPGPGGRTPTVRRTESPRRPVAALLPSRGAVGPQKQGEGFRLTARARGTAGELIRMSIIIR